MEKMKKNTIYHIALALRVVSSVFLISLALPLFASAQSVSASSPSSITLALGNKSVAVAVLQTLLIKKGYLSLAAPTGYFGTATQSALEAFQAASNLPQTGTLVIPSDQLSSFFASVAGPATEMSFGATGVHVQSLQTFLIQGSYLKLNAPTEYFGSLTFAAVKDFQAANDLPQTGVVDTATFAAMNGRK